MGFDPKPTVRQIRATPVLTFDTNEVTAWGNRPPWRKPCHAHFSLKCSRQCHFFGIAFVTAGVAAPFFALLLDVADRFFGFVFFTADFLALLFRSALAAR